MNFKEQVVIARELLDRLSIITPKVVLAGGAPRDWYQGIACNDLDIYMNIPDHTTVESTRSRLMSCLGVDNIYTFSEMNKASGGGDLDELYSGLSKIKRIWQFEYKGITVQIMDVDIEDVDNYKIVDTFQNSLCEFWLNHPNYNEVIGLSKAAQLTMKTNIAFITEAYKDKKHHKKMLHRYGSRFTYLDREYLKGIEYSLRVGLKKVHEDEMF